MSSYRQKRYGNKPRKPRQYRKYKTPPPAAKPSVVRLVPGHVLLDWDPVKKVLFINPRNYHVFQAKSHAQKAIWHSVQASGVPGSHVDYEIEDA